MARVYVSAAMNATIDQAWSFLRDFGALGNYHPYFEKSYIEDGKPSDQVGCVRHFTVRDGGGYLRGGAIALDNHRPDQNVAREAITQAVQDIADNGAGGRGDDADHFGEERQFLFQALIEQTFRQQFLAPVFEQFQERAFAGHLHAFDDDLIA